MELVEIVKGKLELSKLIDKIIESNKDKYPNGTDYLTRYKKDLIKLFRGYFDLPIDEIKSCLNFITWHNNYPAPTKIEKKIIDLFSKLGKREAMSKIHGRKWVVRGLILDTDEKAFYNVLEVFPNELLDWLGHCHNDLVVSWPINSFKGKSLEDTLYVRELVYEDKERPYENPLAGSTKVDIVKYLKEKGYNLRGRSFIKFTSWIKGEFEDFKKTFSILEENLKKKEIEDIIVKTPFSSGSFLTEAMKMKNFGVVANLFPYTIPKVLEETRETYNGISPYPLKNYFEVLSDLPLKRLTMMKGFIDRVDQSILFERRKEEGYHPCVADVMTCIAKITDYEKFWQTVDYFGEENFMKALKEDIESITTVVIYSKNRKNLRKHIEVYGPKSVLMQRTDNQKLDKKLRNQKYQIVYEKELFYLYMDDRVEDFKDRFMKSNKREQEATIIDILGLEKHKHNSKINEWLYRNSEFRNLIEFVAVKGVGEK